MVAMNASYGTEWSLKHELQLTAIAAMRSLACWSFTPSESRPLPASRSTTYSAFCVFDFIAASTTLLRCLRLYWHGTPVTQSVTVIRP